MPLSRQHVEHITRPTRLNLSAEVTGKSRRELRVFLDYLGRLRSVDAGGLSSRDQLIGASKVFHQDEIRPSLPRDKAVGDAAAGNDECFRVPEVEG